MTEISFTSRIHAMPMKNFYTEAENIGRKYFVDYPWTITESIKAPNVYTEKVIDCSSALITDGKEALLIHLNPGNKTNHMFSFVLEFLRGKLDLKNPDLQAVLIGSKNKAKSLDIYNKFLNLFERLGIPTTELKNGKTPTSIAYKSSTDEVLITNRTIDKALKKGCSQKEAFDLGFEKVALSACDEII